MAKKLEGIRKLLSLFILVTFLLETTVVAEIRMLQSIAPVRSSGTTRSATHALPVASTAPALPTSSLAAHSLATPLSGGPAAGNQVNWSLTEVDFSRSSTVQAMMQSQVSVVVKPLFESSFEVRFHQGFERAKSQGVFESSPKSFDVGIVWTDASRALRQS